MLPIADRPWVLYAETLAGPQIATAFATADYDGGHTSEWSAKANVFSLDTPLLLSFAVEAGTHADFRAAAADSEDDDNFEGDVRVSGPGSCECNANGSCHPMQISSN